MGLSAGLAQARFITWAGNRMNVIGHPAAGPDCYPALITPLIHQREMRTVILVIEKGPLTTAALGDMQGNPGNVDPGYPCYASPSHLFTAPQFHITVRQNANN
jgi:hypothetical protein